MKYIDHWPHLLILIACGVLAFFDRSAFSLLPWPDIQGQWWRLITGHLVHTNTAHLGMNLLGFLLIPLSIAQAASAKERLCVLTLLALSISCILLMTTHYEYLGLSSILHGYLIYWLIQFWAAQPLAYSLALLAVGLKLLGENTGFIEIASTEALIAAPLATEGHLAGSAAGIVLGVLRIFSLTSSRHQT